MLIEINSDNKLISNFTFLNKTKNSEFLKNLIMYFFNIFLSWSSISNFLFFLINYKYSFSNQCLFKYICIFTNIFFFSQVFYNPELYYGIFFFFFGPKTYNSLVLYLVFPTASSFLNNISYVQLIILFFNNISLNI